MPSKQGPVKGRYKPAHDSAAFDKLRPRASRGELVAGRPISLSAKAPACVRRFETPTPLNDGRTEPKKDISMFFSIASFLGEN